MSEKAELDDFEKDKVEEIIDQEDTINSQLASIVTAIDDLKEQKQQLIEKKQELSEKKQERFNDIQQKYDLDEDGNYTYADGEVVKVGMNGQTPQDIVDED